MSAVLFASIVFFALLVEAVVGFGAVLLTLSLGAQLFGLDDMLAVFIPVNLCLSLALVAKHWRSIAWRAVLSSVAPWIALGFPFGLLLFHWRESVHLDRLLACLVIGLGAKELVLTSSEPAGDARTQLRLSRVVLALGGVAHGALGTGGPLIVYALRRRLSDPQELRSTLALLWVVLNGALVVSYVVSGRIDASRLAQSAALLLPLLLAIGCGEWIARRVNRQLIARLISVVLIVSGCALLVRSLS